MRGVVSLATEAGGIPFRARRARGRGGKHASNEVGKRHRGLPARRRPGRIEWRRHRHQPHAGRQCDDGVIRQQRQLLRLELHGKVKPAYRGHGASVKLVCQPYSTLGTNVLVFGAGCGTDEFCPPNVDACGNFSFNITTCGSSPQLDNSYVCNFIVHVDDTQAPQACSDKSFPPDGTPGDPNGSARVRVASVRVRPERLVTKEEWCDAASLCNGRLYQGSALGVSASFVGSLRVVARDRIELSTLRFSVVCSTN
jgi:hypothetical protein